MVDHSEAALAALAPSPETARPRVAWRDALALVAPMALLAVLGAYHLGQYSLWRDEVASVVVASSAFPDLLTRDRPDMPNMSAYFLVLHFWLALGETEGRIRFLSVLGGMATVVPIYLIALRIAGWQAGLFAAGVFSTNSFVVIFSREARSYSMSMLTSAVLIWLLLRAVQAHSKWRWAVYGLVAALGLYVHLFVGLVLVAHLVWLVATRSVLRRVPEIACALLPIALAGGPLLYVVAQHPTAIHWIKPITLLGAGAALPNTAMAMPLPAVRTGARAHGAFGRTARSWVLEPSRRERAYCSRGIAIAPPGWRWT